MRIFGELKDAQLEIKSGSDPSWSDHVGGIWWNSTDGKVKLADGTLIRALLRNDQKCVFGNSATAAENIRFQRGDSELLQFLLGNDTTAEGTKSNSIAQIDARLRNWTTGTRPSSASTNKGRIGFNTSTNEIEIDNGAEIVNIGAGGGSLVITEIPAAENIPAGGAPVYIAERDYIEITASNRRIPFRVSAVNYPADIATGTYLFHSQKDVDTFVAALNTAITAAAISGVTVTASFSQSTRKFTFSGTGNFDIMWNTQSTNSAGTTLGYDVSSDDTASSSITSDNEIDDTGTGLAQKAFCYQCHADYLNTSYAFAGFVTEATAQYANASIYKGEVTTSAHNDGLDFGDVVIAKAAITISSSNNAIDWNDGSDRNTTLTSTTHLYPYDTLCTDIKTQMDANASSLTFTVTYDPVTDKFSIVGSSAFTLEWATGTNTATGAHTTLGWTVADTASATTQTSTSAVQKKGRIVNSTSTDAGVYSRNVGYAVEQDRIFSQLDTSQSYTGMLTVPNDWLATPLEKDFSEEGILVAQHENSNGYGVRVFADDGAGEDYHIQYKQGHGAAWIDAATTIPTGDAGTGLTENLTGNNHLLPRVFVDENNKAVLAISVFNNGTSLWWAYAYYSNDLNTWTKGNGEGTSDSLVSDGTDSTHVAALYIRQSKAVILLNNSASDTSFIVISDDSGSGYTTWTRTDISATAIFSYVTPSWIFLQYFPAETGVNKYRIVCCGLTTNNSRGQVVYCKGDGSSLGEITEANTFAAANAHQTLTATMDTAGDGNAIIFTGQNTTSGVIYRCLTNADYNGGTLTTNNFSSATINPNGTTTHETFYGYTATGTRRLILNSYLRSILIGSKHYHLFCLNGGRELYLSYSTDSGTTYSSITLRNGSATELSFEYCMFYCSSINKIVVAYKDSNATADNLTEGKIYAGVVGLNSSGVPTLEVSFQQIDGGQDGTLFQGYLTGSASTNAVNLSWEKYDSGDSRDVVWSNKFI